MKLPSIVLGFNKTDAWKTLQSALFAGLVTTLAYVAEHATGVSPEYAPVIALVLGGAARGIQRLLTDTSGPRPIGNEKGVK